MRLKPCELIVWIVAMTMTILGVPPGADAAAATEKAVASGYVRLGLSDGDSWSMTCHSEDFSSMVMAWIDDGGSGGFSATFDASYTYRALFVRAKAGPVDQTVVIDDSPRESGPWEIEQRGAASGETMLVATWGVWGRDGECSFLLNTLPIAPGGEPFGGHLGAEAMGAPLILQSQNGEVEAGAGYSRDVSGTLFALLIPDTGLGIIQGPEGQNYSGQNSVGVFGEHTSGQWSFEAPVATSLWGLQLWILIVPDA